MRMPFPIGSWRAADGRTRGLRPLALLSCLARTSLALLLLFAAGASCSAAPAPSSRELSGPAFLDDLEQRTFQFFWDTADPVTGLIPDRHPSPSFASVSAVGFGLTAYTIGVERGYVTRTQAVDRVLRTLRFLEKAPQNARPDATGYKGFFYHFLDMRTGARFQKVELSSIDTALLMAGAFTCQSYFNGRDAREVEIRRLVDRLNRRIDWPWMVVNKNLLCMGWSPESGFIKCDWRGYDEAMIMLVMAMGSPTHPVPAALWPQFTATYDWSTFEGQTFVNFGPLFGHQFSHIWIDFRGIQDEYMRGKGMDYAENTRRATLSQRAYAIRNPQGWTGYGADVWGLSACDGPADLTLQVAGRERRFISYAARGVASHGILDDGTLTPNAAAGSLPFTPEISLAALQQMRRQYGEALYSKYGFVDAFNPSFPEGARLQHGRFVPGLGWFDTDYLGIDQGLILAQVENHRSGFLWNLLRSHPVLLRGLRKAGFTGGWLAAPAQAPARSQGRR